jgi:hypothetical protein
MAKMTGVGPNNVKDNVRSMDSKGSYIYAVVGDFVDEEEKRGAIKCHKVGGKGVPFGWDCDEEGVELEHTPLIYPHFGGSVGDIGVPASAIPKKGSVVQIRLDGDGSDGHYQYKYLPHDYIDKDRDYAKHLQKNYPDTTLPYGCTWEPNDGTYTQIDQKVNEHFFHHTSGSTKKFIKNGAHYIDIKNLVDVNVATSGKYVFGTWLNIKVGANRDTKIGGKSTTTIDGDHSLTINSGSTVSINGMMNMTVGKNGAIIVSGLMSISADAGVTITSQAGITIASSAPINIASGTAVNITAAASISLVAAAITANGIPII